MRIPCAKCGHLHESTVSPFLHDTVRANAAHESSDNYYGEETHTKLEICSFKCGKCGSINYVNLTWLVREKKGERDVSANLPEGVF
jgi:ribosomal protein S27AE